MKIREALLLGIAISIICVILVIVAFLFCITGLADDVHTVLPEPEYVHPDEIIMQRSVAPKLNRPGLNDYETFDEALERAKAAIPDELAELAGRAIWGEAGGIPDEAQRAAVVWCACNRADAWGLSMDDVLVESQFHGLLKRGTVPTEHIELARDVLARWALEHEGWQDVGRVLPREYLWFSGDGVINTFRTEYVGGEKWA